MTQHALSSYRQKPESHRLLFLHGLLRTRYPYRGRTVAELLAKGLKDAAVSPLPDWLLNDGGSCPCYLVHPRHDSSEWQPVEVIEIEYDDIIASYDENRPLLKRALIRLWALLGASPRILRLFLPGHPRITVHQFGTTIVLALVFWLVVGVTLAVLVPILLGAYDYLLSVLIWIGVLTSVPEPTGTSSSQFIAGALASLALLAAASKLLTPKNFPETIEDASSSIFAFIDHQRLHSPMRQEILERVRSALRLACGDNHTTSVLAFSLGSLVAIDALFPTLEEPKSKSPLHIDVLITLGCPLAIVARLWPNRPNRDRLAQSEIGRWINYYEARDQLGGSIGRLIESENILAEVEERQFSYVNPANRPSVSPHFTYWLEGANEQRPSISLVASEVVRPG